MPRCQSVLRVNLTLWDGTLLICVNLNGDSGVLRTVLRFWLNVQKTCLSDPTLVFDTFFCMTECLSVWIIFTVYASVPLSEKTSHVSKFKCHRCDRCDFIICQWVLDKLCFIVWMLWTKWSWVQVQMVCLFVKKTASSEWCFVGFREDKHSIIWDL